MRDFKISQPVMNYEILINAFSRCLIRNLTRMQHVLAVAALPRSRRASRERRGRSARFWRTARRRPFFPDVLPDAEGCLHFGGWGTRPHSVRSWGSGAEFRGSPPESARKQEPTPTPASPRSQVLSERGDPSGATRAEGAGFLGPDFAFGVTDQDAH